MVNSKELADELIEKASYTCSPEHKRHYNKAWGNPRPRPDASICPKGLGMNSEGEFSPVIFVKWVQIALVKGCHTSSEGGFPKYIWYLDSESQTVFEGRETNPGYGQYKGYPLEKEEWPLGITEKYA